MKMECNKISWLLLKTYRIYLTKRMRSPKVC